MIFIISEWPPQPGVAPDEFWGSEFEADDVEEAIDKFCEDGDWSDGYPTSETSIWVRDEAGVISEHKILCEFSPLWSNWQQQYGPKQCLHRYADAAGMCWECGNRFPELSKGTA